MANQADILISEYESGENCLTWGRSIGLTDDENSLRLVSTLIEPDSMRMKDFDEHGDDPHATHLKGSAAADLLVNRLVLAYKCNIHEEFEEAQRHLEEGQQSLDRYVDDDSLPSNYLQGMRYAFQGAMIHQVIVQAKKRSPDLSDHVILETLEQVRRLAEEMNTESDEMLVGMYLIKFYFCFKLTRSHGYKNELIEMLGKIITLEPNKYYWHFKLYKLYERQRIEDGRSRMVPCQEEQQALERTIELMEESDNEVHTCYMMYLSSNLRNFRGPNFQLAFGNNTWNSRHEVVQHLRAIARTVEETENNFVTPLWTAAKVFCSILPKQFRDYELAIACCTKALQIRPHSSRAWHLLGKIHENQEDFIEAANRYRQAYDVNNTNFFALHDALKVMMADAFQFEDDLTTFFSAIFPNEVLEDKQRERLKVHFCQGVFFLLVVGDQTRGLEHLETALEDIEEDQATEYYGDFFNQFGWSATRKRLLGVAIDRCILGGRPSDMMIRKIIHLKSLLLEGSRQR